MSRYRIKARIAELGMTSRQLINLLGDEGIHCSDSRFSDVISGRVRTPQAEVICERADKILAEIETKRNGR